MGHLGHLLRHKLQYALDPRDFWPQVGDEEVPKWWTRKIKLQYGQTPQIAHGKPLSLSLTQKMIDLFEQKFTL